EDLDGEAAAADPGVGELLRERLDPGGPGRQVDPQELPGPSIHDQLLTLGWNGTLVCDGPCADARWAQDGRLGSGWTLRGDQPAAIGDGRDQASGCSASRSDSAQRAATADSSP